MDAKTIIAHMENIEALLAPLDTPITPNDAQHRVNNARQIAQGVKVMLEMEPARVDLMRPDDFSRGDPDLCEHGNPVDDCDECEESERYEEAERLNDAAMAEEMR